MLIGAASVGSANAQDFNPRGRKKPPAAAPAGGARPKPNAGANTPAAPSATPSGVLVERYTRIVLAQPGSPFPLQRLAQLYRDRDGSIAALVKDMETRAAATGPERYAAVVTLAGVYKIDGRTDDAAKTFERAVQMKPTDAAAILALAHLLQDKGDTTGARARFTQALPLQTVASDREQTLRTLMTLSLDQKDFAAAKDFHKQLTKSGGESLFVKGELGRELFTRGEFERAEAEFKLLVDQSSGDNRALAPALKDLGKAQAKAHKNKEAVETLRKALAIAGAEAGVRAEIYGIITELYRANQELPQLVKELEKERPSDFARLAILGGLYEETGDAKSALATYRRALAINPKHIDVRIKLVRILQSQGELDQAIAEYEGLIRAAPNNPQFVFDQCDALLQRGDKARAQKLLSELEARAQADEEILSRLADYYGRLGDNEKSLRVLTKLTQVAANDSGHLVDLGDRYFQDGNKAMALQTWNRILTSVQPRSRALSTLAEVYLEHDMSQEALVALREAIELDRDNATMKKQLGGALERLRNYKEAVTVWSDLGKAAAKSGDKLLAREVRSHLVTLWSLERSLEAQVPLLTARFSASPPDLEAGRLLAEVSLRLRKTADAESTLTRLLSLTPGDADAYLTLERVLVQANKIPEAIATLEKLATIDPKRARELYQRMAHYALQIYKDSDAILYAARAVELNPDDAEGHRRLADMYRSKQDIDRAILEYKAALAKNDRLFLVVFDLAELLLSKGDTAEADKLLRRAMRGSPDEELVLRAARISLQINAGQHSLESLEQELLPLAISHPGRPSYRRILVELYGQLTGSLAERAHSGNDQERHEASLELSRIGSRAIKPLLDALAEGDSSEQHIAVNVLSYVDNKNAALPLFAFATGKGDPTLRAEAMLACGALRVPALLPKYEALLFPKDPDDAAQQESILATATWAVGHLEDRRAESLLARAAGEGSPPMRVYAILGLSRLKGARTEARLRAILKSPESGYLARAAAAFTASEWATTGDLEALARIVEGNDPLPRKLALLSLGRVLGDSNDAARARQWTPTLSDALFSGSAEAAMIALRDLRKEGAVPKAFYPKPEDPLDAERYLLHVALRDLSAAERATTLLRHADAIREGARAALQSSAEGANNVLDALASGVGTFAPFVLNREESPAASAVARDIALSLEPQIVSLIRHPDAQLGSKALATLAQFPTATATRALTASLTGGNDALQRMVLSSLGAYADLETVTAVGAVATTHKNWAIRVLAADALGRLGSRGGADVAPRLAAIAKQDPYALVREAALNGLSKTDRTMARAIAKELLSRDPEPRVKAAASAIVNAAIP